MQCSKVIPTCMYQTLDVDLWLLLWSTFDIVCDVDCKDVPQLCGLTDGGHKPDKGWMGFSKTMKELSYLWKGMLLRGRHDQPRSRRGRKHGGGKWGWIIISANTNI